jgi:hypothetical protein
VARRGGTELPDVSRKMPVDAMKACMMPTPQSNDYHRRPNYCAGIPSDLAGAGSLEGRSTANKDARELRRAAARTSSGAVL